MPSNTSTTSNTPNAAQVAALGLPKLATVASKAASALTAWVLGTSTGRRGITAQGTYHAAAAVAVAANNGQPVTTGHIGAMYMALGAVPPGWGGGVGFAQRKGYTMQHSANYGANKHTVGLQHAPGTTQGASAYTVPSAVLQAVQAAMPRTVLVQLASAAQQHLTRYATVVCGCRTGKPGPCGTGRKLGNGQFALAGKPTPAKRATRPAKQPAKQATPTPANNPAPAPTVASTPASTPTPTPAPSTAPTLAPSTP